MPSAVEGVDSDEADAKADIAALVMEATNRFGAAGRVLVEGDSILLHGHGPTVRSELGSLPRQWRSLSLEDRERRAGELARRLVMLRRSSLPPPPRKRVFTLPMWVTPAALGLAVFGAYWANERLNPSRASLAIASANPAIAHTADEYERERQQRAEKVCEETRARVVRGATVSPADVDGWLVELTLLRSRELGSLERDPRLPAFVKVKGDAHQWQLVWADAPELTNLGSPTTFLELKGESYTELNALTVSFHGRYVAPYFSEDQRPSFVRLANTMARELDASYAALYARCEHSQTHQLGAWFQGRTPADAVAALIVFMGTYADVPHVHAPGPPVGAREPIDRTSALEQIRGRARSLDRVRIARLISEQDGMLTGRGGGTTALSFGFRDGNRASRASLNLARVLGLASDQAR
jgi:hypothetical protein